ncbi:MAG: SDR family NAD(P)-dependent oxidoreductase [Candidatus Omnitrophota bacterium]
MNENKPDHQSNRIAVIGMAGRFPGAANVEQFWRNLCNGVESITFFSREQLAAAGVGEPLLNDPDYVRANGVLDGVELFDADFFGMTPREAELTDPQHRLFLECAWEAMENSGCDSESYKGRIAVFAGAGMSTYLLNNLIPHPDILQNSGNLNLIIGNNKDYVPTRVSYKLNLTGPSVNVNTACSSSLAAVHLACQSLLDYQCDAALAGGVGIQIPQEQGYLHHEGSISSPDGHCRAFDAQAQGTVSGNGVAIVVLKRLEDAIEEGDCIRAVILGSAMNNDGAAKAGYTAPSVDGQAQVIAEALAMADIHPESIGYIETHGTGTPLGDPIEIEALTHAFRASTQKKGFCAIGSVKTNVGHLDEAAGAAGLIKTILSLENKIIPPSLHFQQPNPHIDFANSPFFVNAKLSTWDSNASPRRAGVSSFGIGGTNIHVVLEEAPPAPPAGKSRPYQILSLSAKTETALEAVADRLSYCLKLDPYIDIADAAYTLHTGRRCFKYRRFVLCSNAQDAIQSLQSRDSVFMFSGHCEKQNRPIVFMFPGQGSQYVNMGRELYNDEPVFREHIDRCAEILHPILGLDIRNILFPSAHDFSIANAQMQHTSLAQPILLSVETALATLWMSWGVRPQAAIGHSLGEYAAAWLSGVFNLEEILLLVAERGRLMGGLPPGSMLAVPLSEIELQPYLNDDLSIAAINAPTHCVVSGTIESIQTLEESLRHQHIEARRLQNSHAFHSKMMDPIADSFYRFLNKYPFKHPQIPFLSNLTGEWISPNEAMNPDYWIKQLRHPVLFSKGISELLKKWDAIFLETGPSRVLASFVIRHNNNNPELPIFTSLRHHLDNEHDSFFIAKTMGKLWLSGVPISWPKYYSQEKRRILPLFTYPFHKRRCWVDKPILTFTIDYSHKINDISNWFYIPTWNRMPFLKSNRLTQRYRWLIFSDELGLGSEMKKRLIAEDQDIIMVSIGHDFDRIDDDTFILSPDNPDHLHSLFSLLFSRHTIPHNVIYTWNISPIFNEATPLNRLKEALNLSFYSLLHLVHTLDSHQFSNPLRLFFLTNNMQNVSGDDVFYPEKSVSTGPIRVIPKEYPNIFCQNIDIILPDNFSWDQSKIADDLISEFSHPFSEPILAYRGCSFWRPSYDPIQLNKSDSVPSVLRPGGVYLVTGGLGSMGLAFSRYLAQSVQAKLILLHRTPFPSKEIWDSILSSNGEHADFHLDNYLECFDRFLATNLEKSLIHGIGHYGALENKLNDLCASYFYYYLLSMGVNLSCDSNYSLSFLSGRLSILPKFKKYLQYILHCLEEDLFIESVHGAVRCLSKKPPQQPLILRQKIDEEFPQFLGLTKLLDHCAKHYAKALSGSIEAIEVLYPGGTSSFLDECGKDTIEHSFDRSCMSSLCDILSMLAHQQGGKPLRILEFGAGSGVLTFNLIPLLKNFTIEYYFTDISQSFLLNAQKEAAVHNLNHIHFSLLDITKDILNQGFIENSFDLVIGYNVIHATHSIRDSARNLNRLLKNNGLLVIIESVKSYRWINMIWGLAEGWWYFNDKDLRTVTPLLSLDQWENALRMDEFSSVAAFPRDKEQRNTVDAGLIAAQKKSFPFSLYSANQKDSFCAKILKLKEIEKLGSEVFLANADVSDEHSMRDVFSLIDQRFGALHGVIHTAGVLGQGLICNKTIDEAERVFAAKLFGTQILHNLIKDRKLDFFLLCSSYSSISPIAGQIDYCSANAFLDAFAAYHASQNGIKTISIDWGFWQELGMIEQANMPEEEKQRILNEIRQYGLKDAGVESLHRILSYFSSYQIIASPSDMRRSDHVSPLNHFICQEEENRKNISETHDPSASIHSIFHPLFYKVTTDNAAIIFASKFNAYTHWILHEHKVYDRFVLPGTAYLELAFAAFSLETRNTSAEFREIYFFTPLIFDNDIEIEIRTILKKRDDYFEIYIVSLCGDNRWIEHCRGEIHFLNEPPYITDYQSILYACAARDNLFEKNRHDSDKAAFEERFSHFSPRWRCLEYAELGNRKGIAKIKIPDVFAEADAEYFLHPALMDIATGFLSIYDRIETALPFSYKRLRIWNTLPQQFYSYVRNSPSQHAEMFHYDISILDEYGKSIVDIEDYVLKEAIDFTESEHYLSKSISEKLNIDNVKNFYITISTPGILDSMEFHASSRIEPRPNEIEIEISAAGLNFIETLYALGLLPNKENCQAKFGLECSGTVVRIGENVSDWRIGDEVVAFAPACFSFYTTVAAAAAAHKPSHLSKEESATLPAAYTTAYYSLVAQGRLQKDERVLIHAASGGVGLAALNIAQWIGAEIFVTAGTDEKRNYLRSLGVKHVMNSRTLDFANEIMTITNGLGVNLILNSLGGEFIVKSMSILSPYGRLLELGKRDIIKNTAINLGLFEKHLSFIAIDVGPDMPGFETLWKEISHHFLSGHFKPLPYRAFLVTEAAQAFEYMAQAKHIGKIILTMDNRKEIAKHILSQKKRGSSLESIIGLPIHDSAARAPDSFAGSHSELKYQIHDIQSSSASSLNETEKAIANIWRRLLGIDSISIEDNFFELNGDSLLAAQVVTQIHKSMQIKLPLSALFDFPTVASLAKRIDEMQLATAGARMPASNDVEEGAL